MRQYEEDHIEFAILSLVKDPLSILTQELSKNLATIQALDKRLDELSSDWRQYTMHDHVDDITSNTKMQHPTDWLLNKCSGINERTVKLIGKTDIGELLRSRQQLLSEQASLRIDLREETQMTENDDAFAASRRQDCGTRMQGFAKLVREKQAL